MLPLSRDFLLFGRSRFLLAFVVLTGFSVSVVAVGKDRAVLVGSTDPAFLREAVGQLVDGVSPIEGTIVVGSEAELIFNAGSRWSTKLLYAAITHLTYGVEPSRQVRGVRLAFPWPGSSQFTDKPHYVLTVIHRDQTGTEQSDVFELGKNLVRPLLEALERRTAKRVAFLSVDACLKLKSPEECGVGSPDELRGLKRVHVDTRGNAEHRDHIVAEIRKATLGLEVVAAAEDAEISLKFHGQVFNESGKNIDGGRGEVMIFQNSDSHVVLVFTDRDTSVWGRAPAINFGAEFVRLYRKANGR